MKGKFCKCLKSGAALPSYKRRQLGSAIYTDTAPTILNCGGIKQAFIADQSMFMQPRGMFILLDLIIAQTCCSL